MSNITAQTVYSFNSVIACRHKLKNHSVINSVPLNTKDYYPYRNNIKSCGVMIQTDLVHPEWIQVDCYQPLSTNILCQKNRHQLPFKNQIVNSKIYRKSCVFLNGTCHEFIWHNKSKDIKMTKRKHYIVLSLKSYQILFEAVSVVFHPVLMNDYHTVLTYTKYINIFKFQFFNYTDFNHSMLYSKSWQALSYRPGGNVYKCKSGYYISINYICDEHIDCEADSRFDEVNCHCTRSKTVSKNCKYIDKEKRVCSPYYFKTSWTMYFISL